MSNENLSTTLTRPMRNAKGQFLKGHKGLKRPKYERFKENPKLICDTCYMGKECPEYNSGHICTHEKEFAKFKTRDLSLVIEKLQSSATERMEDIDVALLQSIIDGDIQDKIALLLNKTMKKAVLLFNLYFQIEKSRTGSNHGSVKIPKQLLENDSKTSVKNNSTEDTPVSGGILERLFGELLENTERSTEDSDEYMGA